MKKGKILLGSLVALMGLTAFTACNGPKTTTSTIAAVLADKANDEDIKVKGVVYAKATNGFYIADETDEIFVLSDAQVNIGDEVEVEGKFYFVKATPRIKNPAVSIVSTGKTAKTATESTVEAVKKLDKNEKTNYGTYVELKGTLVKSDVAWKLLDDDGNFVYVDANSVAGYEQYEGNRVIIKVVTYEKSTGLGQWSVSYVGDPITLNEMTWAQYVEAAKEDIQAKVPTSINGALDLPTGHKTYTKVTYTWSTTSTWVTIANNKATVTQDAIDQDVELTCVIADDKGNIETYKFTITSKALVKESIGTFMNNFELANGSHVWFEGVVAAKSRNQSGSLWSVVVQDLTTPTDQVQVELDLDTIDNYAIGDKLEVKGTFRSFLSGDRPTVEHAEITKIGTATPKYEEASKTTLATEDDFKAFLGDYTKNYTSRTVLLDHPSLKYHSRSSGDTVDIMIGSLEQADYDCDDGSAKIGISFIAPGIDKFCGSTSWRSAITDTYSVFPGKIYAQCTYVGNSFIMLTVSGNDAFIWDNASKTVEMEILNTLKTTTSGEDLVLPATAGGFDLTWTSGNSAVIADDGKIVAINELTTVTMTATYTDGNGATQTVNIDITCMPAKPLTVTEATQVTTDGKYTITGTVLGFMGASSKASAGKADVNGLGIILSDGNSIIYVGQNAAKSAILVTEDGYAWNTAEKPTLIEVGDVVTMTGLKLNGVGFRFECTEASTFELATEKAEVKKGYLSSTAYTEVTSNETFEAALKGFDIAVSTRCAKIIKMVGTDTNPFYMVGTGTGTYPAILGYADNKTGNTFAINTDPAKNYVFIQLLTTQADNGWGTLKLTDYVGQPLVGEFYFEIFYLGSATYPYYYATPLMEISDFGVKGGETASLEDVQKDLTAQVKTTVDCGQTVSWTVPSNRFAENVTWTTDHPEIFDLTTGVVANVVKDTTVVVTINFTYQGSPASATVEVTVKAPGSLTVTQLVTTSTVDTTSTYNVTGTVIGFMGTTASAGVTTVGNASYKSYGIVLSDGATTIYLNVGGCLGFNEDGSQYAWNVDGKSVNVEVGQVVTLTAVKRNKEAQDFRWDVASDAAVAIAAEKTTVNGAFLTGATTVTNNTELFAAVDAFSTKYDISNNTRYGVMLHLVGTKESPIHVVTGTGSYKYVVGFSGIFDEDRWESVAQVASKKTAKSFIYLQTMFVETYELTDVELDTAYTGDMYIFIFAACNSNVYFAATPICETLTAVTPE